MAGATISTLDAVLKNYYLGPIQDQLNQEVLCLELFEKYTVDWHGKQCVIPVHISRNSSAAGLDAYVEEGGTLPTAGAQGYADLNILAKFQYAKFALTGQAIAAAKKGGANTFISWMDSEMKKLVSDVKNNANQSTINGGPVRGFLIGRPTAVNVGNTTANQSTVAASPYGCATIDVSYDGDYSQFTGCLLANQATWVRVLLTRMDTYNQVDRAGVTTGANPNWFVAAAFPALGYLTIAFGTDTGGAGGDSWNAASIEGQRGVAIAIHATRGVDFAGLPFGAVPPAVTKQPTVTRNAADAAAVPAVATAGTAPIMRSHIITASATNLNWTDPTAVPNVSRAPLALARLQQSLDLCIADSSTKAVDGGGYEPDIILMHPSVRQAYAALFQAGASMVVNAGDQSGPTKRFDGGFLEMSYSGIPIKVSRACHAGMMIMARLDTWCLTELQSAGFADLDGNVLSRTVNADRYEGYYRWYLNHVCKHPNVNVILFGIDL